MRTKTVNASDPNQPWRTRTEAVCEKCGGDFTVGREAVSLWCFKVHDITAYAGNIYVPSIIPTTVTQENYYHKDCYEPVNPHSIKELVSNLSDKERDELYKFLYYTFKCRI